MTAAQPAAAAPLIFRSKNKYSSDFVHEKLRLLAATLKRAQACRKEMSERYKQQFDKRHHTTDICYQKGDQIWVRNMRRASKMDDPWLGPFPVIGMTGRRHVEYVNSGGTVSRTHVQHTKRCIARHV